MSRPNNDLITKTNRFVDRVISLNSDYIPDEWTRSQLILVYSPITDRNQLLHEIKRTHGLHQVVKNKKNSPEAVARFLNDLLYTVFIKGSFAKKAVDGVPASIRKIQASIKTTNGLIRKNKYLSIALARNGNNPTLANKLLEVAVANQTVIGEIINLEIVNTFVNNVKGNPVRRVVMARLNWLVFAMANRMSKHQLPISNPLMLSILNSEWAKKFLFAPINKNSKDEVKELNSLKQNGLTFARTKNKIADEVAAFSVSYTELDKIMVSYRSVSSYKDYLRRI